MYTNEEYDAIMKIISELKNEHPGCRCRVMANEDTITIRAYEKYGKDDLELVAKTQIPRSKV